MIHYRVNENEYKYIFIRLLLSLFLLYVICIFILISVFFFSNKATERCMLKIKLAEKRIKEIKNYIHVLIHEVLCTIISYLYHLLQFVSCFNC